MPLLDIPPYVLAGEVPPSARGWDLEFHERSYLMPPPVDFPRELFDEVLTEHARLLEQHAEAILTAPLEEEGVASDDDQGLRYRTLPLDQGLYAQAMQALHEDAHLKPNEALRDIRIDHDPSCFLIYGVNRLMISADVYELTPSGGSAPSLPASPPAAAAAPAPASPPPRLPKITYGQLREAYAEVQADRDGVMRHDIAVRILGRPQKTDADNEFWYAPSGSDCYVLRLSAKGAVLEDAPAEKCR